jgi:DNA sulfur modification protein DndD
MADPISRLMNARRSSENVGNRRRLFAQFDQIFAEGIGEAPDLPIAAAKSLGPAGGGFRLHSLNMTNWKAFRSGSIVLGSHDVDRPLTLIGGNNGNGKTSILQAITIGLYGSRANLESDGMGPMEGGNRRAQYRLFIERAMHRPAFEAGERMIEVTMKFVTRHGLLEIDRRWYLDDAGRFLEDDEELVLRTGEDRDILAVPNDRDLTEYYEETISRLIAPPSMMPFFLFDGEHVRRLAERDLSEQVRFGIESALGISTLKGLVDDLKDYAKDRARDIQADDAEAAAARKWHSISAERERTLADLIEVEAKLHPLQLRRDEIVQGLGALGNGTYDDKQEELHLRHGEEAQLRKLRDDLRLTLGRQFPMALVGNSLLTATARSLKQGLGETLVAPEGLSALVAQLRSLEPRLDAAAEELVVDRVEKAWAALSARKLEVRHAYLEGHRIAPIMQTMTEMRDVGIEATKVSLTAISQLKASIAARNERLSTRASVDQERERLAAELSSINSTIASLDTERRRIDQALGSIEERMVPINAEWEKRRTLRKASSPMFVSVELANEVIASLNRAIERIVPEYYGILAERVTSIYKQLAHKGVVQRIAIDGMGTVSLMDVQGRDLRDNDASAGENQIFAMSLMAAISDLLDGPLPLIIDTPLGRLDTQHRERILEYFSGRSVQAVLLSQPEEVGGAYYRLIAHKVNDEFHLEYVPSTTGLGDAQIAPGYFERHAA